MAEFGRAKQGQVYPKGSSTIQISATKGQVGFLECDSEVHTKEVVIIPVPGINQRYFNIVLQKNMERFMSKYATGINIQEQEIGNFPIELHNSETQEAVVGLIGMVDTKVDEVSKEIEVLKTIKETMLRKMMI